VKPSGDDAPTVEARAQKRINRTVLLALPAVRIQHRQRREREAQKGTACSSSIQHHKVRRRRADVMGVRFEDKGKRRSKETRPLCVMLCDRNGPAALRPASCVRGVDQLVFAL
jgi:C4-dicarboxylate-specific signal transduction histidine kinase